MLGPKRLFISAVFILMALTVCTSANAGSGSHGGDAVVQDFTRSGYDLYAWLSRNGESVSKSFDFEKFKSTLTGANISSTDAVLLLDGIQKDAINTPDKNQIVINRKRWQSTNSEVSKWAIVSHELFSLMNIDDSKYQISSKILTSLNNFGCLNQDCGIFSYDLAAQKFAAANTTLEKRIAGRWRTNGITGIEDASWSRGYYDPHGQLFYNFSDAGPSRGCLNCTYSWNVTDQGKDFLTSRQLFQFGSSFQDFPSESTPDRRPLHNGDRQALGTSDNYLAVTNGNTAEFYDDSRSFDYSCRLLDDTHMLCAQRLELVPADLRGDDVWSHLASWYTSVNKTKYNHNVIHYIALIKE